MIHGALTFADTYPLPTDASRRVQGFLTVPLGSLSRDGSVDELFRLHPWVPDFERGKPEYAVRSHQSFAQI